jgi:hypothetical protein
MNGAKALLVLSVLILAAMLLSSAGFSAPPPKGTPTTQSGGPASSQPATATQPTTAASQPAAETVKVRIRISNQSFTVSPVDIAVSIDGKQVVSKNFDVGNQHNFESFWVDLSEGQHKVVLKSEKGKLDRKETITITTKMRWIDVMFWTDPAAKFTFELVGEDRPTM